MRPVYRPGTHRMDHLFIHDAELWRKTKTKNPAGGFSEKWTLLQPVKCRISTYTPRENEKVEQEKQQYPITHRIYTPPDIPILADDRIRFRTNIYQVDKPVNPSFADHHLEMHARQLDVADMTSG